MRSTDWAPEHSEALREYLAKGSMSYSEIADTINAKFNTCYSRNAAISRARRAGLAGDAHSKDSPARCPELPSQAEVPRLREARERYVPPLIRPMPAFAATQTVKLRCVDIDPRRLSLVDLGRDDCRYPYGGDEDDEAITFCGHPRRPGSSYCTAHFRLTRRPATAWERAAASVLLRLLAKERLIRRTAPDAFNLFQSKEQ